MSAAVALALSPGAPAGRFALRDYQVETHKNIVAAFDQGKQRQLVVLATGLGKTVIVATLPRRLNLKPTDVVVMLAHRDELIDQTAEKLRQANPDQIVAIEKADESAPENAQMIAASIQTLCGERLERFLERFGDRVALLIIDEAHRAAADTYLHAVNRFFDARPSMLLLGVTATPNRPDGVGLNTIFETIVIERNTRWGIDNGYLVPLRCFTVQSSVSLDIKGITKGKDGDFNESKLAAAVDTPERNALILGAYQQHTPGMKAIIFCASVEHAKHVAELFESSGIPCAYASGSTPKAERKRIVDRFRAGEIHVLVNCGLWFEGFDVPDCRVCILARPTKSGIVFSQSVGRILRPVEEIAFALGAGSTPESRRAQIEKSRKPYGIVLDISDQTKRHSLVTMPTLWGLPPKLDTQGVSIDLVQRRFRQLEAVDQDFAATVTSYDDVVTALKEVSAFRIPPIDPLVRRYGHMIWRPIDEFSYRLTLPPRLAAKNRSGEPMPFLRQSLNREVQAARERGVANPREAAYALLNVDPSTVRELYEHLEIRTTETAAFDVMLIVNGQERKMATLEDLAEAFTRAENWISNNRKEGLGAVSLQAKWRSKPISDHQRRILLTKFRVPKHCIPKTQGDASLLIDQLIANARSSRGAA